MKVILGIIPPKSICDGRVKKFDPHNSIDIAITGTKDIVELYKEKIEELAKGFGHRVV